MVEKLVISTDKAPKAIGAYSQGIKVSGGSLYFFSGQIALDCSSGEIVGTEISKQTEQVLNNIEGLLSSQGLHFDDIVKATIFLKNMSDFQTVNEIYGKRFNQYLPARSAVEVARLPKDVLVEIEIIAAK